MTRTRAVRLGAALAVLAAAALVVFAVDVLRWDRQLAEQDLRFVAVPGQAGYSEPSGILPAGIAEKALAGEDDLAFRRRLRSFMRARPGSVADATEFERLRGEAQLELARLSRVDPDPSRRSRAANMIGVLALDPQAAPSGQGDLTTFVSAAVDAFRTAVEIDPSNADAKRNLELALRIPGPASLPPNAPAGGRDVGRTAGLGTPGRGY